MQIREGVKDFLVGIMVITIGAILIILMVLLWPFITVVGWLVIMLLFIALAILIGFGLIMIIGRAVRSTYRRKR